MAKPVRFGAEVYGRKSQRARRLRFETLEERTLLTVSQDLVAQLQPYQTALNNALDVMTALPLVGEQLSELNEWNTVFQDSVTSLASQVDSLTNGSFELAISLPSFNETFTFDLGLDAFLQVHTSGGVSAAINPVLNVGFNLTNGVPSLDPTKTGLDINFAIGLPNFQLTASLNGLLYASAVDEGTTFNGTLGFNFTNTFGIESHFAGDAHVRLGLSLSLVDPALNASFNPRFFTDFELDWGFNTQGTQLQTPVIAFRNFSLDADSFMQGFLGDTVKAVQKFTQPMQPFIDMFEQPVPIVSAFDSSETLGDLFLKGAGLSEEQQDRFNTMVKIVKAVNTFDFSGTTGGAVINFGDIPLTGDARQAGQFFFNTAQLQGVIDDIMNSPVLQELQDKLETVAEYAGFTADAGFKYPLLENPGPVIGSLLTGQSEVMFSYSTGRQHFELGASFGVGIPDLLGFFINAGVVFDANLSVGYDTAGFLKFIQDGQAASLLHGFYIDNSIDTSGPPIPNVPNPKKTALYLQGYASLSGSAGVTFSGGLYADIAFELASNSTSNHVYLDDIISGLSSNTKVFNPSGRFYAAANIELTIPNPVGPNITLFSHQLSYTEILSFNLPPAPTPSLPLTVIDVTNQHTLLLDVTKMTPGGKVKVQPFHNYTLTSGTTFAGDGIRVDYPGEIVMYVERKNDITTNYYNFVGLSGAVPDGVSIDIIDPFTVFTTEGAPNPQPNQTNEGVLLAGGKNVVYKYTENPGGSLATVLLVGGLGSNSLTGGTMAFGNFVPAARINDAKNHFGNITGFDAAGQAYVSARIDSVLAPVDPTGIIGSTMTGSRGGLMYGGPGNNSFITQGPGAYELVGGPWVDSFNIRPSYNGVPATYAIDGGPGGNNTLTVRASIGENVTFENAAIADKYDANLRALSIQANAGLSAIAHGITKVQVTAETGADITIGDTSLLNIQWVVIGGTDLTFGGSSAPDVMTVTTNYSFFGTADRRLTPQLIVNNANVPPQANIDWRQAITSASLLQSYINAGWLRPLGAGPHNYYDSSFNYYPAGILVAPFARAAVDAPIYNVTRTFGNSGRTQTIQYQAVNTGFSTITLNGSGASDTYNITQGLGSFSQIVIADSDSSTQNQLNVEFRHPLLLPQQAIITNNVIELKYYTPVMLFDGRRYDGVQYTLYPYRFFASSVAYDPRVFFGSNVEATLKLGRPFKETIVNRDALGSTQRVTVLFDGALGDWQPTGTLGWNTVYRPDLLWYQIYNGTTPTNDYFTPYVATMAYDVTNSAQGVVALNTGFVQSPTGNAWNYYLSLIGSASSSVKVLANTGNLTLQQSSIGFAPGLYEVFGNSGNLRVYKTDGGVNTYYVWGNTGTIIFDTFGPEVGQSDVIEIRANGGTVDINNRVSAFTLATANPDLIVNVVANSGQIDVDTIVPNNLFHSVRTQVNVGFGSLAAITGVINLSDSNLAASALLASTSLRIDDRNNAQAAPLWDLNRQRAILGNLQFNYQNLATFDPISRLDLYPAASTGLFLRQKPPFTTIRRTDQLLPNWVISGSNTWNFKDGETFSRTYTVSGMGALTPTFAASNLPPGISIDPQTGVVSGTVAANAYQLGANQALITVNNGLLTIGYTVQWQMQPAIELAPIVFPMRLLEGQLVASEPLQTTNTFPRPVTLAVNGLPTGLTFNPQTRIISGTIALGAAQQGPYTVTITASDGVEQVVISRELTVTGITITPPAPRVVYHGSSVSIPINATSASGGPLVFSVLNDTLPAWLTLNPQTGVISGVVPALASTNENFYIQLKATLGSDSAETLLYLVAVRPGITNYLQLSNGGPRTFVTGETVNLFVDVVNRLEFPVSYSVTGLPAGVQLQSSGNYASITGTIAPGAASPTPYVVRVTATDGFSTSTVETQWSVSAPSTITIDPLPQFDLNATFPLEYQFPASTSLPAALTYSATGLPPGITINSTTGLITGTVPAQRAYDSIFDATITVSDGTNSRASTVRFRVLAPDFFAYSFPRYDNSGDITLTVNGGYFLSTALKQYPEVGPPVGTSFPAGLLDFSLFAYEPGGAVEVTIAGLTATELTNYYKYGPTPANNASHWYNFLFGVATDGDSAVGTGREIIGDTLVLHLIDGGRGDDDLAQNGVIFDIGGPAIVTPPPALLGDYNRDGAINGADHTLWRTTFGTSVATPFQGADGNGNGLIDTGDYTIWRDRRTAPAVVATAAVSAAAPPVAIAPLAASPARRTTFAAARDTVFSELGAFESPRRELLLIEPQSITSALQESDYDRVFAEESNDCDSLGLGTPRGSLSTPNCSHPPAEGFVKDLL